MQTVTFAVNSKDETTGKMRVIGYASLTGPVIVTDDPAKREDAQDMTFDPDYKEFLSWAAQLAGVTLSGVPTITDDVKSLADSWLSGAKVSAARPVHVAHRAQDVKDHVLNINRTKIDLDAKYAADDKSDLLNTLTGIRTAMASGLLKRDDLNAAKFKKFVESHPEIQETPKGFKIGAPAGGSPGK